MTYEARGSTAITSTDEEQFRKELMPKAPKRLSPLLLEKRDKYCIPDPLFDVEPVFNKCFIWQVGIRDVEDDQRIEGTQLYMPETARYRERVESYRGVIVSAGAQALDELRTNGMDVGHTVWVMRLSPWRVPFVKFKGTDLYVSTMVAGDVIASEELAQALEKGEVSVEWVDGQHRYVRARKATWFWRLVGWVSRRLRRKSLPAPQLPAMPFERG